MATVADLATQAAAAIAGLTVTPSRATDDFSREVDAIVAGSALFQLRVRQHQIVNPDGNTPYDVAHLDVSIHYKLGAAEDPRDYTEGDALTDEKTLETPSWWEALAAAFEVIWGPELVEPPDVFGRVVSYSVGVRIAVTPA